MTWLFLYLLHGYVFRLIATRLIQKEILVKDLFECLYAAPLWPIWVLMLSITAMRCYLDGKNLWYKRIL